MFNFDVSLDVGKKQMLLHKKVLLVPEFGSAVPGTFILKKGFGYRLNESRAAGLPDATIHKKLPYRVELQ